MIFAKEEENMKSFLNRKIRGKKASSEQLTTQNQPNMTSQKNNQLLWPRQYLTGSMFVGPSKCSTVCALSAWHLYLLKDYLTSKRTPYKLYRWSALQPQLVREIPDISLLFSFSCGLSFKMFMLTLTNCNAIYLIFDLVRLWFGIQDSGPQIYCSSFSTYFLDFGR